MIDKVRLEKELAQIAEARRLVNQSRAQQVIFPATSRESLEAELAKIQAARQTANNSLPKEVFSHRAGQLGRGFLSEIGTNADLIPIPYNIMAPNEEGTPDQQALWLGRSPENPVMSEQLPESSGLGQEYEPTESDTLGKALGFAGRMLAPTSSLPMAGYGSVISGAAKGLKPAVKALAKDIGMVAVQAAAIKGTPRLTDEGGIPGALEDIAKGLGTGLALSKSGNGLKSLAHPNAEKLSRNEKKVANYLADSIGKENLEGVSNNLKNYESSIGYEPLTAEIAENPAFAQLQRARQGVVGTGIAEKQGAGASTIVNALKNAELSKEDITSVQNHIRDRLRALEGNVKEKLGTLSPRLEAPEAGRGIQKGLGEVLQEKKSTRRAVTEPLYEEVNKNLNPHEASHALNYLENEIVSGDVEKDFDYFKKQLMPKNLTKQDVAYKKSYDNALRAASEYGEDAVENFVKNSQKPKQTSAAQLSAVRKAINSRMQKYKRSGEDERVVMLKELKDKLDLDMAGIKEHQAATSAYKELSKPVSEITGQKALKSVTKKLNGEFTMTESRVPDVFINSSAGSIDDSRALLGQLRNKPEAIESVKGYLHNKAVLSIVDPTTGTVDLKKLESFKKKYPGAKILYPDLYNVKLKDVSHAQMMVNKFLKNTEAVSDTLHKNALGETVGKDTKNIMPNLFNKNSAENMESLVHELKSAPLEKMAALRKETLNYFKKSITNRSAEGNHNVLSYDKMRKFMDSHEYALNKVLTPEQMKVIKGVEKITEGKNRAATQGMAPGSPTNANITNANIMNALDIYKSGGMTSSAVKGALLKLGMGTPFLKEFFKNWKEVQLTKNLGILDKAIIDHNYANFLLSTPLKSKQDAFDFNAQMKKFSNKRYISPELTALARKEQSEEK